MRGVEREVGEPWLGATVVDPAPRGLAEHVGAVALRGHPCAIMENVWIEVGVAPVIWSLADAAALMDEDFVEADILWSAGIGVAEVPFAEDGGAVACGFEMRGEGAHARFEQAAATDGVGDADLEFMLAAHERSAGGGAGGRGEEILEAHALMGKRIEVGRFERGVAVKAEVGQSLVIGEDDQNIWFRRAHHRWRSAFEYCRAMCRRMGREWHLAAKRDHEG